MDDSSSSLSYTVGFSIAIAAILVFAIFHIFRIIFHEIVKWIAKSSEVREVRIQRQGRIVRGRKLSAVTMKRLQETIEKDTSLSEFNRVEFHMENDKKCGSGRKSRKEKIHHTKKINRSIVENPRAKEELTFFAGYSHKHFNDA